MRRRPAGIAMRTGAALLAAGFLSLPAALTPGASSAAEAIPSFIHGTATTSPATATLTSSSPLVLDTFTRANQTGWGTGSGGGTWSTGSALSVASNEGTISYSGTSQYLTLGSTTAADGVGLVRFSIQASNDTAGIILRDQSNGNMDVARYDGAGDIAFMYRISGSWTTVAKVAFPITLKQFYWLRFEVQGSNVMFKAWPAGTSEPSAWTWSGTSTAINAAGEMGLYGYAASGAPVEFELLLGGRTHPAHSGSDGEPELGSGAAGGHRQRLGIRAGIEVRSAPTPSTSGTARAWSAPNRGRPRTTPTPPAGPSP